MGSQKAKHRCVQKIFNTWGVLLLTTYLEIIQKKDPRTLAYALFSIIVEKEHLVIIVEDENERQMYEDIIGEIVETFEMRKPPSSDFKLAPYEIVTKREYYLNWRKFAGKRLIFTDEDKNLICPGIDHLEKIVRELFGGRARDPITKMATRLSDVLTGLEVARSYFLDYKKGKLSEKELLSILRSRFLKQEDLDLAYALLKTLYDP